MTEIKRYVDQYPVSYMTESDSGDWVDYDDHAAIVAALQEQVRALAADNANMKGACGGDGSYVDCPGCTHSQYIEAPETPATDAALREIQAQGLDKFSSHCRERALVKSYMFWTDAATVSEEFAARIRSGEQP